MDLKFKNELLKGDYELSLELSRMAVEKASEYCAKNEYPEEKMAMNILMGYLSSLCEITREYEDKYESHPTLDLTYGTVQHLPFMLAQQYFVYVGSESYTSDKAVEILNKTFAAYIMLLCMNEHDCMLEVQRRKDFNWIYNNIDPDETHVYSWSGFTVKVGTKNKYDLLPEMSRVVKVTANGTLRIRISRVVEIYKRMCGIDLREKGLDDLEGCV